MKYSNDGDVVLFDDFNESYLNKYLIDVKTKTSNKKIKYFNIPSSFDIESTSFYEKQQPKGLIEKRAIMYEWTFGINGLIIIGRRWEQFLDLCNMIVDYFKLNLERILVVYVHNLSYEMQFIRKWFSWEKVFCSEERKPFYALTKDGIEFRCSYLLSGYSLSKVGDMLSKYKVQKMVGDLDYKLLRNDKTILSDKELKYCINDVRVVMSYIQEKIENDGDITQIPLTKTGYVRKYCKHQCFYGNKSHKDNSQYIRYRALMNSLTINMDEYNSLKRAFMGGFTHASSYKSRKTYSNVHSYDFTSSYPYVMLSEKFPMNKGEFINIKTMKQFEMNLDKYLCVFDIEFYNIESIFEYEHYISISKCRNMLRVEDDNGRVAFGERLRLTITNIDFEIIKKCYKWDKFKIGGFIRYQKNYLPKPFIESIINLYEKKTTLKGVDDRYEEYMNSKEMLNSCYGMSVTDIVRDEITYDDINDEWGTIEQDKQEQIDKYNSSQNRFLFYPWGIFVTAYARRNLWMGIFELKGDYIYSDTDSLKFTNLEKHKSFFDNYNDNIVVDKLQKMCNHHNIDFNLLKPKTIKGVEKLIGVFDYEGKYEYFKTLGAKRYMVYKDNQLSVTISGVNKINAIPFLLEKYKSIDKCFDNFDDGLIIPQGASGKQTHTYIDIETRGILTDYQGNTSEYHELSSVHLEESEYCLSMSDSYLMYLMGIEDF